MATNRPPKPPKRVNTPSGKPPKPPQGAAIPSSKPARPTPEHEKIERDSSAQHAVSVMTDAHQRASLAWFHSMVKGQTSTSGRAKSSARRIPEGAFLEKRGLPILGKMYFYVYDAKFKDELPYWDKFPLVIPIKYYADGWLGLNLHYLPPKFRAPILDRLTSYTKSAKTSRAFMKISYDLLKAILNTEMLNPMIHRYLASHVKTQMVEVKPQYWTRAAMLPVQQFQKASSNMVWSGK